LEMVAGVIEEIRIGGDGFHGRKKSRW
jgi:hypothetical protein